MEVMIYLQHCLVNQIREAASIWLYRFVSLNNIYSVVGMILLNLCLYHICYAASILRTILQISHMQLLHSSEQQL